MVVDRHGIVDVDQLLRKLVDRLRMTSVDRLTRTSSFPCSFCLKLICIIALLLSSSSYVNLSCSLSAPGVYVTVSTAKLSWWCSSAQLPIE
ncbi:hypothetical protein DY000_02007283 [Brassica cretica]|uniref:EF-hand domain-containing protein n=1 Tax=Brassica cretica TaxID=69181 RepID=A0ABQ7CGB6_BRACR|nr:hypothetical protein DY000_02007283 [Brassica cretica]